MAGDRITWVPTPTNFPEGTAAFDHYVAHLGLFTSPHLPIGTTFFEFPLLAPGEYASSVDTVALDGTVLATHAGPLYRVPTPVSVPVAMNVTVARVP